VKRCQWCERELEDKRADARFCKASCRVQACRARRLAGTMQRSGETAESLQGVSAGAEGVNPGIR
jgi:hypothetical protein